VEESKDIVRTDQGHSAMVTKQLNVANDIQLLSGNTLGQDDAMLLASMYGSGYFKDMDSMSKAVTKCVFGKMLGMPVAVALTGLYIIDGKPGLEAKTVRNTLVQAGYTINTKRLDDEECVLEFIYKGTSLGETSFSMHDAMRRGYVDPTCYDLKDFPKVHNDRQVKKYNKFKKQSEQVTSCYCKDNWRSMPQEMLMARATTKGANSLANQAFNNQEFFDKEELEDSPFKEADKVADARTAIKNAKTLEEIEAVTKDLDPRDFETLMQLVNERSREIIENENSRSDTSKPSTAQ
jgi:hypothetical protein